MMKRLCSLLLCAAMLAAPLSALAHSGRTDANGGHYNRKTGEYHYHNGGTNQQSSSSSSGAKGAATEAPAPKPTTDPEDIDDVLLESDFPITMDSPKQHIRTVQSVLIQLGDLTGAADGSFGKKTAAALTAAAERHGEVAVDACSYALFIKLLDEAGDLEDAA